MRYEYIFYRTDASFDYGQGTCHEYEDHGFSIDIDINDVPSIDTLEGFGDFADANNCKDLPELYNYIETNKQYATGLNCDEGVFTVFELLEELQGFISPIVAA